MTRRSGLSLADVAVAIAVAAILLATVAGAFQGRYEQALARRAVSDAWAIAEAAVRFYWRTGSWPPNVAALVPADLPPGALQTPWGGPWEVAGSLRSVTVRAVLPVRRIPDDLAAFVRTAPAPGGLEVAVSRPLDDGGAAGALYEKRHLYGE
jgi:hypothetical protein